MDEHHPFLFPLFFTPPTTNLSQNPSILYFEDNCRYQTRLSFPFTLCTIRAYLDLLYYILHLSVLRQNSKKFFFPPIFFFAGFFLTPHVPSFKAIELLLYFFFFFLNLSASDSLRVLPFLF